METIQKNKSRRFAIENTTWTPPDKDEAVEFIKITEQTLTKDNKWTYMKGKTITLPLNEEVINGFCDAIKKEFGIEKEIAPF